jgi:hypothetical protein
LNRAASVGLTVRPTAGRVPPLNFQQEHSHFQRQSDNDSRMELLSIAFNLRKAEAVAVRIATKITQRKPETNAKRATSNADSCRNLQIIGYSGLFFLVIKPSLNRDNFVI